MNYCCITRRQTDIKWKGNFISRDILFLAKSLKDQYANVTAREAIQTIQNEYSHFMSAKTHNIKHGDNKALTKVVKEFLRYLENGIENNSIKIGGYRA